MRWGLFTWFGLCLVPMIAGAQEIGPEDIVPSGVREEISDCLRHSGSSDGLSCFDLPGVTQDARELARATAQDTGFGMAAILENFHEAGDVDVAEVFFPLMANTNWQMALVNGPQGPQLAAELFFRSNPPRPATTREILRQHPNAMESNRVFVFAVRPLPEGGQRFVLTDVVTDGCRACQPVAVSIRYFDFSNGRLTGGRDLGWHRPMDVRSTRFAERLRNADVRAMQFALNMLGYDAGPVDGAPGPRTMAAFSAFKRDHCLSESNRGSEAFIRALSASGYPAPPCAPAGAGTRP